MNDIYVLRRDVDLLQNAVKNIKTTTYYLIADSPVITEGVLSFTSYQRVNNTITTIVSTLELFGWNGSNWQTIKTVTSTSISHIHDGTYERYRCNMKINGELVDYQTITVVKEGANNVALSNEAQIISCNYDGSIEGTQLIEIGFWAYKGTSMVASHCTATSYPDSFTITSNIDSTVSNPGKIIFEVQNGAMFAEGNGLIDLSFTIDDETIEKKFSWAKSIKNATPANNGLNSKVHIKYGNIIGSDTYPKEMSNTPTYNNGVYYTHIGICSNHSEEAPTSIIDYKWSLFNKDADLSEYTTLADVDRYLEEKYDVIDADSVGGVSSNEIMLNTITNGTIHYDDNNYLYWWKQGNIVFIHLAWNTGSYWNTSEDPEFPNLRSATGTLVTLPSNIIPVGYAYATDYTRKVLRINTDGTIRIYPDGFTSGAKINTSFSYLTTNRKITSISALSSSIVVGNNFNYKLVDGDNNPLPNKNIVFNINNKNYNKTTNSEGIASLTLNLIPGNYTIKGTFNSDAEYLASNVTTNFTLSKKNATATYISTSNNVEKWLLEGKFNNGVTIQVKQNNVVFDTLQTDSQGFFYYNPKRNGTVTFNTYNSEYINNMAVATKTYSGIRDFVEGTDIKHPSLLFESEGDYGASSSYKQWSILDVGAIQSANEDNAISCYINGYGTNYQDIPYDLDIGGFNFSTHDEITGSVVVRVITGLVPKEGEFISVAMNTPDVYLNGIKQSSKTAINYTGASQIIDYTFNNFTNLSNLYMNIVFTDHNASQTSEDNTCYVFVDYVNIQAPYKDYI